MHTELANIGSVPGVSKGPTAFHSPRKAARVSLSYSPYKLKMTSRKLKMGRQIMKATQGIAVIDSCNLVRGFESNYGFCLVVHRNNMAI